MTAGVLSSPETSISISCVIYDTDFEILATTIKSLFTALQTVKTANQIGRYEFSIINNQTEITPTIASAFALAQALMGEQVKLITGHGNVGYGRGNNLAINQSNSDYHLILNPDVDMDKNALFEGIQFLQQHPEAGLVAPNATNEHGEPEYLAKRTPNLLIIFLRGVNNIFLNKMFKKQLDNYAYKDKFPVTSPMEIELASGCFMLCRTATLKQVGGFSKEYFLYFEDFDLSRKVSRLAKIYLLPKIRIIHLGGKAASKGMKHIKMFIRSYFIFRANAR